jgi:glycosyltransferase involved in cell wall biosynthesis
MKLIVEKRSDIHLAIVGGGTYLEELKKYCSELGLDEYVDFYGRVEDKLLVEILNTADICVNPDKPTEMNNLSTMNKIMEYMSLKKPIVQFDLKEGRFSAQEASLYANSTKEFADQIEFLADNDERRDFMGDFGYNRVINELSWDHESLKLIDFYKKVLKIN